jgi:hypothetical protein
VAFSNNTLRKRGWTTQELNLAPRILWLSSVGAVWTCPKENRAYTGATNRAGTRPRFLGDMKARWIDLLESYSATTLSFSEDRLPALSGICKYVDPNASDQYLAGFWLSSMPRALFWGSGGPQSAACKDMSLPSWSPLAIGRAISHKAHWLALVMRMYPV